MKTLFLSIALTLSLFSFAQEPVKNNAATVSKYSGMPFFIYCEPVKEYTVIATVRKTIWANSYEEYFQKIAKYTKEQHPDCEGVIFHTLVTGFSKDSWDAIKFKD